MHILIALKFIDKQTNLFMESKEIFVSCRYSRFCELCALVYDVVEINIIVTEWAQSHFLACYSHEL